MKTFKLKNIFLGLGMLASVGMYGFVGNYL